MASFEKCPNCGAPLESSPDGRRVLCGYCGAGQSQAIDPVRLVASLRAETHSLDQLFESLAQRFAGELPDLTRVETSGGFFSSKRIQCLEITFPDHLFRMKRGSGRITTEKVEIVRGIALKTEVVATDTWLQALCEALSGHASSNAAALEALRRIGG
jgi:hypothetical protein